MKTVDFADKNFEVILELFILEGWKLGRFSKISGEDIKNHKLTEYNVIEIKKLIDSGELSQQKISEIFNVARETIGKIKRNQIWQHITTN